MEQKPGTLAQVTLMMKTINKFLTEKDVRGKIQFLAFMKKLVDKGLKVEILITGNMSKKFKRANKVDASYAIILGEEELSKNIIKLKNLIIGSERYVSLDEAIKVIKNL